MSRFQRLTVRTRQEISIFIISEIRTAVALTHTEQYVKSVAEIDSNNNINLLGYSIHISTYSRGMCYVNKINVTSSYFSQSLIR